MAWVVHQVQIERFEEGVEPPDDLAFEHLIDEEVRIAAVLRCTLEADCILAIVEGKLDLVSEKLLLLDVFTHMLVMQRLIAKQPLTILVITLKNAISLRVSEESRGDLSTTW